MGIKRSAQADADAALPLIAPKALPPHLWRTGIINFLEDDDGIGRRYWLWYRHSGWAIPSLPTRAALDAGSSLPDSDSLQLHWYAQPFERVSYRDVYLDSLSEHPKLGARFVDRTVIIGTAAPGLHDLRPTPLSAITPGPQILATAIANLEHGDYLSTVSPTSSLVLGLVTMGLIGTAFHRQWHPAAGAAMLLAIGLGALAAAYTLLRHDLLWQPYSALAVAASYYVAAGLWSYLRERRRREHTTQMFGRFLDPAIVATLSDENQIAEASASAKREVSVLFSDIRGFTSLSETREPEEVVALLNRYFDRQVEAIFTQGGTLDKFIGDAIMAFWGAPVDRPDHAHAAVLAAMSMVEQLEAFKQELGDDLAQFDIGIGVHTGPAVVGFLGSKRRLDYTAIGDTVNLASRIEGETKGRARVLVSEATRNACDAYEGCRLDFVDMGEVTVKGRHKPVRLYQPMWRHT
jgi:adenylate cyclase